MTGGGEGGGRVVGGGGGDNTDTLVGRGGTHPSHTTMLR